MLLISERAMATGQVRRSIDQRKRQLVSGSGDVIQRSRFVTHLNVRIARSRLSLDADDIIDLQRGEGNGRLAINHRRSRVHESTSLDIDSWAAALAH